MIQQPHFWYVYKRIESRVQKRYLQPMFIAALLAIVRKRKQSKWLLLEEWIKKLWYIQYVQWNIGQPKKIEKRNPIKCDNREKPGGHYAGEISQSLQNKCLHDYTSIRYLNSQTHKAEQNRTAQPWVQGIRGSCYLIGIHFRPYKISTFQRSSV